MTIETTCQIYRFGHDIALKIGGEILPAGQLTEFDQWQPASAQIDWIEDVFGNRWAAELNFSPAEIEQMKQALLDAVPKDKTLFPNLRGLLGLPKFDGK